MEPQAVTVIGVKPEGSTVISTMTLETLNGASLEQGDYIDWLTTVFTNRADLPLTHDLAANGFNTPGFTTRFVAKTDLSLADNAPGVINNVLTPDPADDDNIAVIIERGDTINIDFGSLLKLPYTYEVSMSNGTDRVYSIDRGEFFLIRTVAADA